ncbi:putrescine aminotransferase [Sinobacterium caligoides]|uniref:Putrescine aminotransferase n=1 Tax=Sinobacterium caligoides TaxID=933926 RepID=A0A3N2DJV9_9GAMM|nr:aspartate aminotransferase family protein [Sinobacterium caligoides]ROS00094.1 putrescine aminotransferase [Sinobacterium caligoides]
MTKPVDNATIKKMDRDHYLHPFSNLTEMKQVGSRIIERAEGVYLYDSDGHRTLDGFAGLWCVNLGYGRDELSAVAAEQMKQLPYYNSFFGTTNAPAAELAALLKEVTPPQFNHVFFTGSGSESNDTVVRMVRRYWQCQEQPSRKVIISRKNAYHGSTIAGASLGGMGYMHKQDEGLPMQYVEHIDQPYWFAEGGELTPEEFGLERAGQLEQKILELGEDNVAAFIAEPIQGAGGVIVPPASYWPEIQRICRQYNILLVSDEVICGFGRTGHWFGCEHFGVEPDLMSVAKGMTSGYLPMGGVIVSDKVANVLVEKGGDFNHGFTYSGHPVSAAVAVANIKALRDEGLIEEAASGSGAYFRQQLQLLAEHPVVGEVRSVGLVGAIELCADKQSRDFFPDRGATGTLCRLHALENGLVLRATEDTMLFSPPLVISHAEIDEMMTITRASLDHVAKCHGMN